MSERVLLITGATGQQGGAVVDALVKQQADAKAPITILGLTRNPDSASAKKLASKSPLIKIVKGDLSHPGEIFSSARAITGQPVWGVFSVQTPLAKGGSVEQETQQGKGLVDESIAQGVKHFVQASVDRGGNEKSWSDPTEIPHFKSKHEIELHLRDSAAKAGGNMTWTILRPVAFMDNYKPGFGGRVFLTALQNELHGQPLQFVAVKDIGIIAAQALKDPASSTYKNQAIGLAGDSLTAQQIVDVFQKEATNGPTPTFGFLGSALTWGVKEMGTMIRWFDRVGYGVDIESNKKLNPGMLDMAAWIKQESEYDLRK